MIRFSARLGYGSAFDSVAECHLNGRGPSACAQDDRPDAGAGVGRHAVARVGIGVNTAVFSWIQAVVLQPHARSRRRRRVSTSSSRARKRGSYPGVSWLEYRDLVEQLRTLPDLIAFRMAPFNVGDTARHGADLRAARCRAIIFPALGLRPAAGRFLRSRRRRRPAAGAPVVIVSYEFWQTRWPDPPGALGQTIRVNDRHAHGRRRDAAARFRARCSGSSSICYAGDAGACALCRIARARGSQRARLLGDGEAGSRVSRARRRRPTSTDDAAARARLSRDERRRSARRCCRSGRRRTGRSGCSRARSFVLQGVMLLLLLAVCGNTANLVLARASARQREIGVRARARRGPRSHRAPARTENLVLALGGRGARHRHRRVGNATRCAPCPFIGAFADPVPDERRRRGAGVRARSRSALRVDRRRSARASSSRGIDPQRRAPRRRRGGRPQRPAQRADGGARSGWRSSCSSRPACFSEASTRRAKRTRASRAKAYCSPPTI